MPSKVGDADAVVVEIRRGDDDYMSIKPINPIGFSYSGSVVYRAVPVDRRHRRSKKTCFAVTVAKAFRNWELRDQIRISDYVERNTYRAKPNNNLLETRKIVGGASGGGACVVFPYCDMGSLRSIMRNAYPLGFPEDLILIALRSVLKALSFIHSNFTNHRDINAAHIYLTSTPPGIKLGFAATIYEDAITANTNTSSYFPVDSISQWGAAPEYYYAYYPKSQNTLLPSDKVDVWLVGITALELAYGGLRVENRDALEAMINEMHHNNKLPDPSRPRERKRDSNKLKHYVGKFCYSSTHEDDDDDINGFSEAFTKMVLECLDEDPENRPSVDDLLSSQLFTNTKDARYFYHAVIKKYNS